MEGQSVSWNEAQSTCNTYNADLGKYCFCIKIFMIEATKIKKQLIIITSGAVLKF